MKHRRHPQRDQIIRLSRMSASDNGNNGIKRPHENSEVRELSGKLNELESRVESIDRSLKKTAAWCTCYLWPKISTDQQSSMHELNAKEIELIVRTHNKYRDLVAEKSTPDQPGGIIPLVHWDHGLAQFAHNYLMNNTKYNKGFCKGGHNPNRCYFHDSTVDTVGENISYGTMGNLDIPILIKMWYDEHKYYKYNNMQAQMAILKQNPDIEIGHYTQLVWARSTKIGCAVAKHCERFETNYEYMLLCNYNPAGGVVCIADTLTNSYSDTLLPLKEDWVLNESPISYCNGSRTSRYTIYFTALHRLTLQLQHCTSQNPSLVPTPDMQHLIYRLRELNTSLQYTRI